MSDVKAEVASIERSVDAGLRNLVRFGTQEQADQANNAREKLRLAAMDQALASLESRNEAILGLVVSLQTIVDGLRHHPVGGALDEFRNALADGELLLDSIQHPEEDEVPIPHPAPPESEPGAAEPPSAVPSTGAPANTDTPHEAAASPAPAADVPRPVAPAAAAPAGHSMDLKLDPPNERFRGALLEAAKRCMVAPSALAAVIDAEAAKKPDGGWDPNSANPRSSARGLTQFLSATWLDMACRGGTFLNELARSKGFLDGAGKPLSARLADLLDLRFDAKASIITAADFAKQNLAFLERSGCIAPGCGDDEKARFAYLAHHEGAGGARDFLKGTLAEARAERLLRVNAGSKASSLRNQHGSWRSAYVAFLNAYIDRKIRPERFRP